MAAHGVSERRACSLADLDRSTFQYPKREGGDEPLRKRLRELAGERRRFGYRRLGILPAREGLRANHKKLYRLYTEERLTVKRRRGRKRAMGTRRPMLMPAQINQRWSLDFVSDALTGSRRFRTLCVVGDFTREALAVVVDASLSGLRVARELDRLIEQRGKPKMIVRLNKAGAIGRLRSTGTKATFTSLVHLRSQRKEYRQQSPVGSQGQVALRECSAIAAERLDLEQGWADPEPRVNTLCTEAGLILDLRQEIQCHRIHHQAAAPS